MIEFYYHPEYIENKDKWKKARALYLTDNRELKSPSMLWYHELEHKPQGQAIRLIREERSTYTNYLESIVSIWQTLFMAEEIEIDEQTELFLEQNNIDKNINGSNKSISTFIRDEVLLNYFLYGKSYIYVVGSAEVPATLGQAQQMPLQVQWKSIDPLLVVDWNYSVDNKLLFLRTEYEVLASRFSATDKITTLLETKVYSLIDGKFTIQTFQKDKDKAETEDWKLVNEVILPEWSEIPIVKFKGADSWVSSIQQLMLKHYNLESTIDNIHLYQAHQRICYIGNRSQIDTAQVAEYSIQLLPENTSIQVINPVDTAAIERRIEAVMNNIFKIGLNQSQQIVNTIQARSADALKEEKHFTYTLIESEIESLEAAIEKALLYTGEYYNQTLTPDVSIKGDTGENSIDSILKIIYAFKAEFDTFPEIKKSLLKWALEQTNLKDVEALKELIEGQQLNTMQNPIEELVTSLRTPRVGNILNGEAE